MKKRASVRTSKKASVHTSKKASVRASKQIVNVVIDKKLDIKRAGDFPPGEPVISIDHAVVVKKNKKALGIAAGTLIATATAAAVATTAAKVYMDEKKNTSVIDFSKPLTLKRRYVNAVDAAIDKAKGPKKEPETAKVVRRYNPIPLGPRDDNEDLSW